MIRIGVDFGGTKIEAAALDADGGERARLRRPNPGNYAGAVGLVASWSPACANNPARRAVRWA